MYKFWSIGPYDFEFHPDTGHLAGRLGGREIGIRNFGPSGSLQAAKIASATMALQALDTAKFRVFEFLKDLLAEGVL